MHRSPVVVNSKRYTHLLIIFQKILSSRLFIGFPKTQRTNRSHTIANAIDFHENFYRIFLDSVFKHRAVMQIAAVEVLILTQILTVSSGLYGTCPVLIRVKVILSCEG